VKEEEMRSKIFLLLISFVMIFSINACKKKEEQPPVPQTQGPMATGPIMPPGQMPPGQMSPGQMPSGQMSQGQMPPGQMPPGMQQGAQPGMMMPKGQSKVIIPDSVKGKWDAAKIIFEDKTTKAKQEYTVNLNSDFKVPNTSLKIHVGEFLPDFKMDGLNLTSGSNELKNPALGIRVFDKDKQIFPGPGKQWGWLFSKVPTIHPFEHPKYSIILKEGVKKG
jgi:hypothetical protein